MPGALVSQLGIVDHDLTCKLLTHQRSCVSAIYCFKQLPRFRPDYLRKFQWGSQAKESMGLRDTQASAGGERLSRIVIYAVFPLGTIGHVTNTVEAGRDKEVGPKRAGAMSFSQPIYWSVVGTTAYISGVRPEVLSA